MEHPSNPTWQPPRGTVPSSGRASAGQTGGRRPISSFRKSNTNPLKAVGHMSKVRGDLRKDRLQFKWGSEGRRCGLGWARGGTDGAGMSGSEGVEGGGDVEL